MINKKVVSKIIEPYYLGESKVLQYFGNVRHNSAAPDALSCEGN